MLSFTIRPELTHYSGTFVIGVIYFESLSDFHESENVRNSGVQWSGEAA